MKGNIQNCLKREELLQAVLERWKIKADTMSISLDQCLDYVTAEDIAAIYTIPVMRVSAMDGFAVKSTAFQNGVPDLSGWVYGEDYVSADTGDDFPDAFDSVIPVEQLHYDETGTLQLEEDFLFTPGSNIRPAGSMMQAGDLLVRKNTRITPGLLGNLAAGGITIVPVLRKPVVTFIPTGSELVSPGSVVQRGQNIDSNSAMIGAYLRKWGAEVIPCQIIRDDPELLKDTMNTALHSSDIVILNGGSSKGKEDFNTRIIQQQSGFFLHGVRTVPGRPVGIAFINDTLVINMPGPSMAAWVVNDWLLHPLICHYYGIAVPERRRVQAIMAEDLKKGPAVELYSRVKLERKDGVLYAVPYKRGSRLSESLREGTGLLILPIGTTGYEKGQRGEIELLAEFAL